MTDSHHQYLWSRCQQAGPGLARCTAANEGRKRKAFLGEVSSADRLPRDLYRASLGLAGADGEFECNAQQAMLASLFVLARRSTKGARSWRLGRHFGQPDGAVPDGFDLAGE